LQDLIHSAITEAAHQQKLYYDKPSHVHSFVPGDLVWLSNSRSGKLQPCKMARQMENAGDKTPTDIKISDGQSTKVVHVNRQQHCKQPQYDSISSTDTDIVPNNWFPPQINHHNYCIRTFTLTTTLSSM